MIFMPQLGVQCMIMLWESPSCWNIWGSCTLTFESKHKHMCLYLSLYTSGRGHGKKFSMFCASCLPGGLIPTLGTFSHGSLYCGWSVFNGGCHLQYGMPLTHATYFPFVYSYHIFLLSFRRKKVVFCLACRDARRGAVQITTGCIAGFWACLCAACFQW